MRLSGVVVPTSVCVCYEGSLKDRDIEIFSYKFFIAIIKHPLLLLALARFLFDFAFRHLCGLLRSKSSSAKLLSRFATH